VRTTTLLPIRQPNVACFYVVDFIAPKALVNLFSDRLPNR
jgi:hypothetical protein